MIHAHLTRKWVPIDGKRGKAMCRLWPYWSWVWLARTETVLLHHGHLSVLCRVDDTLCLHRVLYVACKGLFALKASMCDALNWVWPTLHLCLCLCVCVSLSKELCVLYFLQTQEGKRTMPFPLHGATAHCFCMQFLCTTLCVLFLLQTQEGKRTTSVPFHCATALCFWGARFWQA